MIFKHTDGLCGRLFHRCDDDSYRSSSFIGARSCTWKDHGADESGDDSRAPYWRISHTENRVSAIFNCNSNSLNG